MPAPARSSSETPITPGRRAANVPVDSPSTTTSLRVEDIRAEAVRQADLQAERASYVGRRRASVPASPEIVAHEADIVSDDNVSRVLESLAPDDQTTSFANEDTTRIRLDRPAPEPVVATYVSTSTPGEPAPAGKRRASKHTGTRGPLFKALPSAPVLVGIAALALSIGGAVTVNDQAPASSDGAANALVHASALSGSGGTGTVSDRDVVTSRDSDRTAQGDAGAGGVSLPDEVSALAEVHADGLQNLAQKAEKHAQYLALDLWQYPLSPVILTARFGQYGLWSSYHTGLDFNGETGDQIHAIANGVVTFAGYDGSYGNKTVVTLDDGTELWYCHQTSQYVGVGDTVTRGDVIGTVGSTGHVTGSHLHVEVRPGGGDPVDPYPAMQQHGLFLGDEAMPG